SRGPAFLRPPRLPAQVSSGIVRQAGTGPLGRGRAGEGRLSISIRPSPEEEPVMNRRPWAAPSAAGGPARAPRGVCPRVGTRPRSLRRGNGHCPAGARCDEGPILDAAEPMVGTAVPPGAVGAPGLAPETSAPPLAPPPRPAPPEPQSRFAPPESYRP